MLVLAAPIFPGVAFGPALLRVFSALDVQKLTSTDIFDLVVVAPDRDELKLLVFVTVLVPDLDLGAIVGFAGINVQVAPALDVADQVALTGALFKAKLLVGTAVLAPLDKATATTGGATGDIENQATMASLQEEGLAGKAMGTVGRLYFHQFPVLVLTAPIFPGMALSARLLIGGTTLDVEQLTSTNIDNLVVTATGWHKPELLVVATVLREDLHLGTVTFAAAGDIEDTVTLDILDDIGIVAGLFEAELLVGSAMLSPLDEATSICSSTASDIEHLATVASYQEIGFAPEATGVGSRSSTFSFARTTAVTT